MNFYFPSDGPAGAYDRSYFPKDFTEDIRRYADVRGRECPEVHSSHKFPDYSVLSKGELDYYLWWRDNIRNGKVILADSGYAWLYACELIHSEDDPKVVLDRIIGFTRACGSSLRMAPMVCNLAEHYALAHDLSFDPIPDEGVFSRSIVRDTWALTRYPIRDPNPDFILPPGKWLSTGIDYDQMYRVVCLSLRGIDEYLRSSGGMGLIRAIGCDVEPVEITLFGEFANFTDRKTAIMPVIRGDRGPLALLLDGIVRTATRLMREDGKRGSPIPRDFPELYRKVVAASVDAVVRGDPYDPAMFRVASVECNGFWMDDDLSTEIIESDIRPKVYVHSIMDPSTPHVTSRTLDSKWDLESDIPVDYVNSGRAMAYYDDMDEDQSGFYIYWRTMARRGTYLNTDVGYLWLYVVEIINHDEDPVETQRMLDDALEAYSSDNSAPKPLCTASLDHAILHGFDPNPLAVRGNVERYILCRKLCSDPIGDMNIAMANALACYDSDRYTSEGTYDYERAFTLAVRAVDDYMRTTKGKRLYEIGGRREFSTNKRFYSGLWVPKFPVEVLEFVNVYESKKIITMMDGILKYTIREIRRSRGQSSPRMPLEFREEYARIVVDTVRGYLDEVESEIIRMDSERRAEVLRIDRDAVKAATVDLEAVRSMMAVEDPDVPMEEVTVSEPIEGMPSGWSGFFASLDDVEMGYLATAIDGCADPSVLKGTGRRANAVEDSINSKAMDIIGDVIIEEGIVVEDYLDDIMEGLQ